MTIGKEQAGAYDQWHESWADQEELNAVWHQFILREITGEDLRGKKILEIGCGRGELAHYIATLPQAPAVLYACDYSLRALEIAENRYGRPSRVVWQQENIQSLSFPDNTFDCIISCETIEHVPDPKRALYELYRVLKPGGIVYLTCPNYFNFFGLWCIYRYTIGKPYTEGQPYVNYLMLPRLKIWIKQAGFRILSHHTSHLIFPLRAHYILFHDRTPAILRWLGFRTFFKLQKQQRSRS